MTTLVADRPSSGATPPWSFPAVERRAADGVQLLAAHLPARPLVHVTVLVDAGGLADPSGLEGAAALLGSAALRGAAGRGEHALAVAFERVGAVPSIAVHAERSELAVEAPGALVGEALSLLADVLRDPTLAEAEVLRVRDARIDALNARMTDSGYRAARAASRTLFDAGSRYATATTGTVESLGRLGRDDLVRLHAERWASARPTLVLAGDLTDVDLDAAMAALAGGTDPAAPLAAPGVAATDGTRIAVVDVPGSVQSVLSVRALGPAFGEGDVAALEVAQSAVFRSFTSRVNLRLREELGYTYGARGEFTRLRAAGWAEIGCSVRTEVTADSVREIVEVTRAAVAEGLTEDEVAQARENLTRTFAVRYDGPAGVGAALVRRAHNDLPDDERDAHLADLRTVTAERATAALRAALPVDDLAITVAGDAGAVRSALTDLDLGPVTDAD